MLVLPIVNKNRILNVKVSLKGITKVREEASNDDFLESDIIVNGRSFINSHFCNSASFNPIVDFIRANLVSQSKNYSVVTKKASNGAGFDVYKVDIPPAKVSDVFDRLYEKAVLDISKETPGILKSKYLTFKNIGLADVFSDENVQRVRKIVANVYDQSYWTGMFEEEGLTEMFQILDLINILNFTIVSGSSISEESLLAIRDSFDKINSKDTKSLNNYYNMAIDNQDIYGKMSYVSMMVFGRPLNLIKSGNQKKTTQLVKSSERVDEKIA